MFEDVARGGEEVAGVGELVVRVDVRKAPIVPIGERGDGRDGVEAVQVVPPVDDAYLFDHDTTMAILAGFALVVPVFAFPFQPLASIDFSTSSGCWPSR